jgi:hypothetical protein
LDFPADIEKGQFNVESRMATSHFDSLLCDLAVNSGLLWLHPRANNIDMEFARDRMVRMLVDIGRAIWASESWQQYYQVETR